MLGTKTSILAVSATGESEYYRIFMKFTAADSVMSGVTRKTSVTAYTSEGADGYTKLNSIIEQYGYHLAAHKDVEARSTKAIVLVDSVSDAKDFADYVNDKNNDLKAYSIPSETST